MVTETMLRAMARGKPNDANLKSVLVAIKEYGPAIGLDRPHRQAHYLAQLLHEGGSFKHDREIWGPTPAQKRYEGRTDLGNVQKGDGSRYRGRGPIQITGRDNYRAFTKWARKIDPKAPNFEQNPDAVNTDPWEGLGPIWYWDAKGLNKYADDNNIEMVTRLINGGLNGYADRLDYYVRAALVILGYKPTDVKRFQQDHKSAGTADGIAGEKTRMALHQALYGVNPYRQEVEIEIPVPVPVDKPVVPESVVKEAEKQEKRGWWQWLVAAPATGLIGWFRDNPDIVLPLAGVVIVVAAVSLLGGRQLVRRVKDIQSEWSS